MIKLYGGRGEGPGTTPSFVAAGTGHNSTGDVLPEYPAVADGMLFAAQIYTQGGTATPIAGWSAGGPSAFTDGVVTQYVYFRDERSSGSDSGPVTFPVSAGAPNMGIIYAFRDVALEDFWEAEADPTYATDGNALGPTIPTLGNARLACAFVSSNNGVSGMAAFTGETGGDWTEAVAEHTSGIGPGVQLQTAPMPTGGTISGGTAAVNGTRAITIGFALVGT